MREGHGLLHASAKAPGFNRHLQITGRREYLMGKLASISMINLFLHNIELFEYFSVGFLFR